MGDEKKIEDAVVKALAKRMPEIMKTTQKASEDNKKKAGAISKEQKLNKEKSVMRSVAKDGDLAIKAPFIKLGAEMESFIKGLRNHFKAADQNIANDEEGGYLVAPAELDSAIIQYQFQESVIRRYATIRNTKGNSYKINKLDQSANSFGGVVMYWKDEGDQLTRSQFKLGQLELTVKKLTGLTVASNEILQDSVDVANFIVQLFGEAVSYMEDMSFFQGDGTDRPQGILNYPSIQSISRAVANQVSLDDINSMYHSLRTKERAKGIWFGSATAIEYLDGLKDGDGRPLLAQSPNDPMQMRIKGKPVVELDEAYLPALGTKGDLIFVDPSKYYILDKTGLRIDVSPHSRFEYDEVEWRFVKRTDGQFVLGEAGVVLDIP